jgi:hypothetical protein
MTGRLDRLERAGLAVQHAALHDTLTVDQICQLDGLLRRMPAAKPG